MVIRTAPISLCNNCGCGLAPTTTLYASTDFGVLKLVGGTWVVAGQGLPMVEIRGLTIVSSERLLYAATHGRSAWKLSLP